MRLKQIKTLLQISHSEEIMRRYFVVNGIAPLVIALVIILPLWLANKGVAPVLNPMAAAIIVATLIIFLLGIFPGRIGGTFWLWSGLQSLAVATVTMALIYLVS